MKLNRSDRHSFVAASAMVAFTAGALLLSGCSPSDTSTATSATDPTAATATAAPASQAARVDAAAGSPSDPCTLLSAEAVAQAYSVEKVTSSAKAPQKASNGLTSYLCEYHNAATDSSLGVLTISPTDPSVSSDQVIAAWQNLPGAESVSGVGDAAVYTSQGQGSILGAAKHTSEATVAVMYTGPKAAQDKLAVLVRTAIGGL